MRKSVPNRSDGSFDDPSRRSPLIEAVDTNEKPIVSLYNLRKTFPGRDEPFVAVKSLSLDMYNGTIFTLLGHNGAGKTTTINMLTGLYNPTDGFATMMGYDTRYDMKEIRRRMGVCPQHDILYPYLTVREHLELFASIKNVPSSELHQAVTNIIDEVGLGPNGDNKADSLAGSLSGGQMRKLSVGIALIGGSEVVFLDEPSSGVDISSQRAIWEILLKVKKDRLIILTTHSMEEAELGDQIAIMAEGKLQCLGSSYFLKSLHGVGYTLTISKKHQDTHNNDDSHPVVTHIKNLYPFAELLSNAGSEVSYRLPFAHSAEFPPLFRDLEEKKEELQITSFSVSVTTLTEVFLKVGHGHNDANDPSQEVVLDDQNEEEAENVGQINLDKYGTVESNTKDKNLLWKHTWALLVKRWNNLKRDRKAWLWQVGYPCIILLGSTLILQLSDYDSVVSRTLSPTIYPQPSHVPVNTDTNSQFGTNGSGELFTNYEGMSPVFLTSTDLPDTSDTAQSINSMQQYLLNTIDQQSTPRFGAFYVAETSYFPSTQTEIDNDNYPIISSVVFFNTSAQEGLSVFQSVLTNVILAAGQTLSLNVLTKNLPMPLTSTIESFIEMSTSTNLALAMCFVPASFIAFIVKEKADKTKHLQYISGVSVTSYWLSNLIFDVANFAIPFVIIMIILVAFNITALIGAGSIPTIIVLWLYAIASAPFTYALSFLFNDFSTAQNTTLLLNFLLSVCLYVLGFVLTILDSTKDAGRVLKYFFRIFPSYCLSETISSLLLRDTYIFDHPRSMWDLQISGFGIIYLVIDFFLYSGLVLLLEYITSHSQIKFRQTQKSYTQTEEGYVDFGPDTEIMDDDVATEKALILNKQANDRPVVIGGLNKVYPPKMGRPQFVAVYNLFYTVKAGECFGFLGANGAGKTTAIRMLTGDEKPTLGTAKLGGYDIVNQPYDVRRIIGYCPQFDAFSALLSARENLTFYARIKCVPPELLDEFVNALLEKLNLKHLADKPAGTFSGGNKRKLSVGIALIGNPPIVFLDEPSTGMDPQARRSMWKVISTTMNGRSVILTTHSMEECEALCDKIGVMTRGRLRCLGSSQHLKQKYGTGFQVTIKTKVNQASLCHSWIQKQYPNAQLIEAHGTNLKFKIPKENLSISKLFSDLEKVKDDIGIDSYAAADTDLDQIFINFVKMQEQGLYTLEKSVKVDIPIIDHEPSPTHPMTARSQSSVDHPNNLDIELTSK